MKKIMFNDKYGLTDVVLEGRKTMTRRIIKGDYEDVKAYHANGDWHFIADTKDGDTVELKPTYEIGETVAVAQSYQSIHDELAYNAPLREARPILEQSESEGWSNKMFVRADFMPHRIRITDIKLERLHDISNEDCMREGIRYLLGYKKVGDCVYYYEVDGQKHCYDSPRMAFATLIDKVSGRGTWNKNPWVFAYSFELIK